jgi:hypothetical protein
MQTTDLIIDEINENTNDLYDSISNIIENETNFIEMINFQVIFIIK